MKEVTFLLDFVMEKDLDVINSGNKPTFITRNMQKFIPITLASNYASNFIKNWKVSDEVNCSDHRHIRFDTIAPRIQTVEYEPQENKLKLL